MRRVGDAAWRRFNSQSDATKAFGVSSADVSDLVRNVPQARLRGSFEARRVASEPAGDADNAPGCQAGTCRAPDRPRNAIEMRRVGDASWRRFAFQYDAAKAFGADPHDVS